MKPTRFNKSGYGPNVYYVENGKGLEGDYYPAAEVDAEIARLKALLREFQTAPTPCGKSDRKEPANA